MIISILPHRLVPLYLDRGFLSILATSKMGMITILTLYLAKLLG